VRGRRFFFQADRHFQLRLGFPQVAFAMLDQSHQERRFEVLRLGRENLSDALLGIRVFLSLEVNLRQQQSEFGIPRLVFEGGFQKVQTLRSAIRDQQVVRFFHPERKLFPIRAAIRIHNPLHAVSEAIHFLGLEDSRIQPSSPVGFQIL